MTQQVFKSDFLNIMNERGFINAQTNADGLDEKLTNSIVTAYIGFDCTASSLHVGSLVQIMMLRWLQKTGHKPLVVMGGGTTKIGDPSGKDEARQLLDDAAIQKNMDSIKQVFTKFIHFGENKQDAIMVNNDEWLSKINYIDFLRDYGRHFSVNRMLSFDSVKLRLEREQPLSFLEFNYMIFQAYDFLELYRRYGCSLQMGGSDQWGNIVNGIELTRRIESSEIFGLTTPLLTTASGAKMGKTASGAIWLNEDMLSSWNYWQFWRNTDDADVIKFLKLFTELPINEIDRLGRLQGAEINEAKKILATEATKMLHGIDAANLALETAKKTFEQGGISQDLPTFNIDVSNGISILDILIQTNLAPSKSEARRLIKGGAIKVNDINIANENHILNYKDRANDTIKLSSGKKNHVLIK